MEAKAMQKVDEEKQAKLEIWNYALVFTPMAALKCAIELQLADALESNGGAITHTDLSAAVTCSPPILRRIMRYLIHRRIFKETITLTDDGSSISYTQTPLSKLLIRDAGNSMAAFVLLETSGFMLDPWHKLSSRALRIEAPPSEEDIAVDPELKRLMDDAVVCVARQSVTAIVDQYPEVFHGIGSLVDVRGGNGGAIRALVKECPWIQGINFDFPNVVSAAPQADGIEHVAGNLFDEIPQADAAFLRSVLHDWGDEECIRILRRCREAIPSDKGKVIIVDAVIREGEDDKYSDVRLALDMAMLALTESGKERTFEEWAYVVKEAGFTRFTAKHIEAITSVIEAYP